MKSGICPKCGSDEIYENSEQKLGDGNVLTIKHSWYLTSEVGLEKLVCADCGYLETYIADSEALLEIRKFWKPYQKEKRKNDS